ncbi:MAG: acetyl-CoA carboxylase biotin carboxyl carrier protein subunit [Gemmatimonadetes bacterium]|nr:acetyl-CoA carboxylase biotin carboxyl carrier protein subunit [Gemmatimonadota bacterium]
MLYHVTIGTRVIVVELQGDRVIVDGVDAGVPDLAVMPGTHVRHLLLDGRSVTVVAHRDADAWNLHVDGWPVRAEVVDERTRAIHAMTSRAGVPQGPRPVRAPMPGMIVRTEVSAGDRVRAGQGVVVMEAMKMENELKAEADGIVARVLIEPGQAVEKGAILVEFQAADA